MKLVFFGTSDFAVPSLRKLKEAGHQILAVVTQPDRPKGRGLRPAPSPLKAAALELGLTVHEPEKLQPFVSTLRELAPEVAVIVAYGKILSKEILAVPPLGFVNLHASLLPKYRGPAPIQGALLAGERVTGNTVMVIDESMDTGPIIAQEEVAIEDEDTAGTLHDKLKESGASLLVRWLPEYAAGRAKPIAQNHNLATYTRKITKEDGEIAWSRPADKIKNLVRAMNPWPVAFGTLGEETWRIYRVATGDPHGSSRPGEVVAVTKDGIAVAGQDRLVWILKLQVPGHRRMTTAEYLRGHSVRPGLLFQRKSSCIKT